MGISKVLKTLSLFVLVFVAFIGYNYGEQLSLDREFNFDVAFPVWVVGAVLAAVLYGLGELIYQQWCTNYMLSHSLTPRDSSDNKAENDSTNPQSQS